MDNMKHINLKTEFSIQEDKDFLDPVISIMDDIQENDWMMGVSVGVVAFVFLIMGFCCMHMYRRRHQKKV